jgi:hypothetical protein
VIATRNAFELIGKPWVIENVPGAPLRDPVMLCGVMFDGLRVYRHRLFESNQPMDCVGAALWRAPSEAAARSVAGDDDWHAVLNLARLVVAPHIPTNAASFLLGQSIRMIRRDGRFRVLVTYADETQGHTGGIYRATNWTYLGLNQGKEVWTSPTGQHVNQRTGASHRSRGEMETLGYRSQGIARKHKFVMYLDPKSRPEGTPPR